MGKNGENNEIDMIACNLETGENEVFDNNKSHIFQAILAAELGASKCFV